jgi:hypothetical protein
MEETVMHQLKKPQHHMKMHQTKFSDRQCPHTTTFYEVWTWMCS